MAQVAERVDRLEEALAKFMEQTTMMLAASREDIAEIRASNARTDRQLLEMQRQAEKDRQQADKDREQIDRNREQADKDREQVDRNREQVDRDREQVNRDREQVDKDRQQAEIGRQQADKDRQQADKDRQRADQDRQQSDKDRQQSDKDRQQSDKDRQQSDKFWQQVEVDRKQAEKERKEFNRQLAALSDRLGTLIEDMVAPNAPRIARSIFRDDEVLGSAIRLRRQHPSDSGRSIELDLVVYGRRHLLVCEAKSKVTPEKAAAFLEKTGSFAEFFPEYNGFTVVPMIASVSIEPSLVSHLTRLRIYALGFGDETMEILNQGEF